MKNLLFSLLGILIMGSAFSQANKAQLSGQIQDGGAKTLLAATISLHQSSDSSIVKMAIANKEGFYTMEHIPFGKYFVSVTAVGHSTGYSEMFELNSSHSKKVLPVISLVPEAKSLGGVTVTSKKPLVEQKIDRTIVNVDASITNVGSSALDVLEKSPGITVDKDGNISLKGKEGVIVLVDGRQTHLSGADLANMLRTMNAGQLEQLEIMTNPPAKFDAAGNAGVINIKTKKNKQEGYNGSINLNYAQGRYPKVGENINMNYRKNKINLFANASHSYRKNFNNLNIQRNFRDETTKEVTKYFDQGARMKSEFRGVNAKVGVDYFASKNTTIGLVLSGFRNPGNFTNSNLSRIYNPPSVLVNETVASVHKKQSWKNFSSNLNFRHVLDTAGKELTADLDFLDYSSRNNQTLINSYFDANGNTSQVSDTLLGNLPQSIRIYSGKIDYLHPLKNEARFEAGIKTSFVRTDANALYDSLLNGNSVPDLNRSNHFIYEENINAAYVNLSTPLGKKWSGQWGLRMENTIATGKQLTNGQEFKRNYTQLFPTAYFQYKPNDKHSFVLNYGRRIRRPDYHSLNPFINFLDRYTYQQGNPDLKPQFSHNIELSHLFKGIITTTLNYSKTTDIIQQVIEQNEEKNETYVKQANIASREQIGLSVNMTTKFAKWHSGNVYVNVYNNSFKGIVNDTSISISGNMLSFNASQQFTFNKGWSAEVSGFYNSKLLEGVFTIKPFGMLNLGVGKQIMKNKGTIRLTVRDVFYSRINKGESRYGNVDARFQENGDSRQVNLGFSYRFSKGKVNGAPKRRAGSATDEQNRVGVGGN